MWAASLSLQSAGMPSTKIVADSPVGGGSPPPMPAGAPVFKGGPPIGSGKACPMPSKLLGGPGSGIPWGTPGFGSPSKPDTLELPCMGGFAREVGPGPPCMGATAFPAPEAPGTSSMALSSLGTLCMWGPPCVWGMGSPGPGAPGMCGAALPGPGALCMRGPPAAGPGPPSMCPGMAFPGPAPPCIWGTCEFAGTALGMLLPGPGAPGSDPTCLLPSCIRGGGRGPPSAVWLYSGSGPDLGGGAGGGASRGRRGASPTALWRTAWSSGERPSGGAGPPRGSRWAGGGGAPLPALHAACPSCSHRFSRLTGPCPPRARARGSRASGSRGGATSEWRRFSPRSGCL